MSLYPNLLFLDSKGKQSGKIANPWTSIKSHRGRITHINFKTLALCCHGLPKSPSLTVSDLFFVTLQLLKRYPV